MFDKTADQYVPDLIAMIKVTPMEEYEALVAVNTQPTNKIPCSVVLAHSFAEAIQSSDISLVDTFIKIVDQIKLSET